jgi:Secretion system C-terminal sorting domain/WD40-like Beta Propeller Repeat
MSKLIFVSLSILFIVILLFPQKVKAQYPEAPEIWSVPEEITVISQWAQASVSPSINFQNNKLYFSAGGIAETEKTDTVWGEPFGLNSNINQHLAENPCISPNGKRIFFDWYLGGWDEYYSDWDSTANDWGTAVDCGPNVNIPGEGRSGCTLPNDTTLIFLSGNVANISYWDSTTQSWGPSHRWPTQDLFWYSDWGIYVSPNYKKIYYSLGTADTTIGGEYYFNYDLYVSYRDTTIPGGYNGTPYKLNFCLHSDSEYFEGNYVDRFEGYPTLTPNGKTMYFTATYHGQFTIYESHMLIDENGVPVNVEEENRKPEIIPGDVELYPAYPNPFNPNTVISWQLTVRSNVKVTVYNILGEKIAVLVNERQNAGEHKISFNADEYKLSSGTYIVELKTGNTVKTQKIILIK